MVVKVGFQKTGVARGGKQGLQSQVTWTDMLGPLLPLVALGKATYSWEASVLQVGLRTALNSSILMRLKCNNPCKAFIA